MSTCMKTVYTLKGCKPSAVIISTPIAWDENGQPTHYHRIQAPFMITGSRDDGKVVEHRIRLMTMTVDGIKPPQ